MYSIVDNRGWWAGDIWRDEKLLYNSVPVLNTKEEK